MKKLLLLLFTFFLQINSYNIINLNIRPDNAVFVFDLHDVILKYDSESVWSGLKSHPEKAKFLKRLGFWGVNRLTNGSLKDLCIEHAVIKDDDSDEYITATLQIVNPYRPYKEAIEFVKLLHLKGFKIFACSNIGERSLCKLKSDYPELKDLFENYFSGFQIPNRENNFLTKMHSQAYKDCKKMIDSVIEKKPQYILFIDDSYKKIRVAESAVVEFKGVEFKSIETLKKLLRQKKVI